MKHKCFFLISGMVLSSFNLFSQIGECGTTISVEEFSSMVDFETANVERQRAVADSSDEIQYFPIRHHIIRRSDGTGGLSFSVDTIVRQLNAAYIRANIQFYSNEVNFIFL